jgi:hypothetical protein
MVISDLEMNAIATNVQGLLLCWNQSLSSPEPLPKNN